MESPGDERVGPEQFWHCRLRGAYSTLILLMLEQIHTLQEKCGALEAQIGASLQQFDTMLTTILGYHRDQPHRRRLVLFKHHFNSVFGPNVLKGVSAGRVYAVAVHLHVRGLVVRRDAESLVAAPADADPPGGADGPAPVRLGSDGVAGGAGTLPPPPANWTIKDKATVVVSVLVP